MSPELFPELFGNVQTRKIALGAMSKDVTLAADYDYNNNLKTLAANIGDGSATFDTDGTFSYFSGGTNDFENTYLYDTLGDLTEITQTGQSAAEDGGANDVTDKHVKMSYDGDQRLSGVNMYQSSDTDNPVSSSTLGYDGDSDLTKLTYNTAVDNSGTWLAEYHWDYNTAGVVTDEYSRNDSTDGSSADDSYETGSDWGKTTYAYDADAELKGVSYSDMPLVGGLPVSVGYDSNGNRNASEVYADSSGDTASSTPVSSTDRLLFDGTYYYSYDADGNRTAKWIDNNGTPEGSPQSGDTDITIYTWNNANELTSATHYNTATDYQDGAYLATGEYSIKYGYDALGEMVTRKATIGDLDSDPVGGDGGEDYEDDLLLVPTTTENFIYNGQNIVLILDQYGDVLERNLTGQAADQVFATEAVVAGVTNWLLTDNQGTVRDVVQYDTTTSTTEAVDHLVYGAFGQLVSQQPAEGATDPSPIFFYNGTWQDPQTGLNDMRARWYAAVDAVFLSMADPAATNPYEFAGDDPTNDNIQTQYVPVADFSPVGLADASGGDSGGGTPVFADSTDGFNQFGNGFGGGFVAVANAAGAQAPPLPNGPIYGRNGNGYWQALGPDPKYPGQWHPLPWRSYLDGWYYEYGPNNWHRMPQQPNRQPKGGSYQLGPDAPNRPPPAKPWQPSQENAYGGLNDQSKPHLESIMGQRFGAGYTGGLPQSTEGKGNSTQGSQGGAGGGSQQGSHGASSAQGGAGGATQRQSPYNQYPPGTPSKASDGSSNEFFGGLLPGQAMPATPPAPIFPPLPALPGQSEYYLDFIPGQGWVYHQR